MSQKISLIQALRYFGTWKRVYATPPIAHEAPPAVELFACGLSRYAADPFKKPLKYHQISAVVTPLSPFHAIGKRPFVRQESGATNARGKYAVRWKAK